MEDETLRMLRDSVDAFTDSDSARVRAARSLAHGYDRDVWHQIGEQGWIAALVPEGQGGLGLGCAAAAVIASGLGRAAFPEPYVSAAVLPATALSHCHASPLATEKLSTMASGEAIVAVAWQNEVGGLDPRETPLAATREGGYVLISGTAHFVMAAGVDAIVAVVRQDDALAMYWVPAASGLAVGQRRRADWGHDISVTFESFRLDAGNLLAQGDAAFDAMHVAIDTALVAAAAELTGATGKMVEMTLEYLRTRSQFGKQIGSFQALKHRAVDLWMHTELSKAAVASATEALTGGDLPASDRSAICSGAKARASDTALFVGKQAIQMHGAIGVTDEYDLSLYFNRALVLSAYLGNGAMNRSRYARMKGAQP